MSKKNKGSMAKGTAKGGLVPKLRFPEFRDAEGWEDVPIGSVLDVRDDRRVPSKDAPLYSLTIENGITAKTDRYNREFLVRDSGNKKYKLVEPNDIVYNPSNLRWGAINYSQLTHSVVVSPIYEVLCLEDSSENFLEFIACSVMRGEQIRRFITKGQGTLVERIAVKIDDFLSTKLPVPPTRAEQQKIADCLSSIDELITAEAQKLHTLKAHKKGLMQQLFPAEGEKLPELRFPEFRNAGEWLSKSIGQVYEFKGNNSLSREKLNYNGGSFRNIHYGDIHTKYSTLFDITKELVPYVNSSELLKEVKEENYCIEGDMIFADASEDLADIGKSIEIVNLNSERVLSGLHTILARQRGGYLVIGFAGHLFKSNWLRTQIQKESQGAKVLGLSSKRLARIEILFPSDKLEQQIIADCLSSIDELITAQSQKLNTLKTHKKGLMQQLFPAISDKREC